MLALSIEPKTWAHRISVGVKMAILVLASFWLFSLNDIFYLSLSFCLSMGLYASLGKQACMKGLRALSPILWMMGIVFIFHILRSDVVGGCILVLRILIMALLANFVTMTSRLSDTIELVLWLLWPLKKIGVNIAPIGLVFAMVMRFTPVLIERAKQLTLAWRARAKTKGNWRIIMPMFISVIDDAEHISEALRARGGTIK